MVRNTARREELAALATDYVLDHGLIGLSLRPLAAAIGTSDRMLLYHFAGKDDLVATVLRISNDRSVEAVRALPRSQSVRTAVLDLWRASTSDESDHCHRVYVEAAALGLLGREPYVSVVREANERWVEALADHLVAAGCTRERAGRAVALLDAAFMGLQLDLPLDPHESHRKRVVSDLADAIAAFAGG
ncbi:TetR/AcrR family transcriptional regulator [Streptomyces sp. V4I2]|uniref:TetR/AcrR family transcriptional regulator n=1 Tax=Streptomyces sp. V4I2 TaxID=3042280 RepID=UPI00278568FF|nr:TetR/AcrR family transcriptional regulator [Streptomyces sp. V4I2]MDQ1042772.1 AcrR family transcriptional regulator [Streptomyces sp. V4I2]MDQ1050172.1 AcrR family transcriptional regulator [Streptomyces sp. V4I2]